MNVLSISRTSATLLSLFLISASALAQTGSFTYEGFLTDDQNQPIGTTSSPAIVSFEFEVIGSSSAGHCRLSAETQALSVVDGHFSARIGSGSVTPTIYMPGRTYSDFFMPKNSDGLKDDSSPCTFLGGEATALRFLRVSVNGNVMGQVAMTPAPMATVAARLGTLRESDVMRTDGTYTTPAMPLTFYTELVSLVGGTSSRYLSSSTTVSGDVTGAPSNTVVSRIQGHAVDSTAPADGQVLKWNAVSSRWEASTDLNSGGVATITGAAPVSVTAGANPVVSIADASTTGKGVVRLALDGESNAAKVVMSNDNRLSNARMPLAHTHTINQIFSTSGGQFLAATGACTPGSRLEYLSPADNLSCQPYGLTSSQVTTALGFTPVSGAAILTGLTGDLTTTGSGVASATINVGAVTDVKIAGMSINKLASGSGKYLTYAPDGINCANLQTLKWSTANNRWECGSESGGAGSVTTVTSANSDISVASSSTTPVLTLNSGTAANQLVKLDGAAKLPAVNGSALTNLSAANLSTGVLDVARFPTTITDAMWVSGSGNVYRTGGAVGVGTTSPKTALHVVGSLKLADGAESCAVAADGGMIRYTSGNLQMCNGSSWQTLSLAGAGGLMSLGGQSNSAQSFATGAAGNAPAFASSGGVHTLNIPLASSSGSVTSGTISNAQYLDLASRQPAGSYLTGLSGDVVASGPGTVASTIQAGVVTTAKLGTGAVTDVKVTDVGIAKITSATGKYFTYAPNGQACAVGEILKWNNSRWECAVDSAGAGSGTVTSVTGSGGLTGTVTTTGSLSIATGGVTTTHLASTIAPLTKNGNIANWTGAIVPGPADLNTTTTIDFSGSNIQYTAASCGVFNLRNMKDGGSYMFVVKGLTAAACSFNAYSDAGSTALVVRYPAGFGNTTSSRHTIFNFVVVGTDVYVAWTPGYQ